MTPFRFDPVPFPDLYERDLVKGLAYGGMRDKIDVCRGPGRRAERPSGPAPRTGHRGGVTGHSPPRRWGRLLAIRRDSRHSTLSAAIAAQCPDAALPSVMISDPDPSRPLRKIWIPPLFPQVLL